ncbi:MAG: hypothetical protein J6K26_08175 [Lachnospiraceae bacterium]|nr:hypothetical protein [Lachnospiraceae bacterium]
MKKKIKINFVDFWTDLIKTDNYFYNILKKYYDVEISDEPDYVFCSCFGNQHFKYQNCIKILFLGENIVPDFNLYDYAMGFHYIDFEDRYLRLPLYVLYDRHLPAALKKHEHSDEYYLEKPGFCNYVVSNPNAAGERDRMLEEVNQYKTVDCGGRYRNNVGGPVKDKIAFAKNYRFTIAFENSTMSGYTTEKIFEAFAAETIPIYWGSPRIAEEFNPEAFINCHDFPDLPSVVEKIKEINENDDLYLKMIKAPMICEDSQAAAYLKEDYADTFLCSIFDQEQKDAYRRNMVYIGRDYQKKLKDDKQIEAVLNVVKRPMHLYNKKKAQWKSRRNSNK